MEVKGIDVVVLTNPVSIRYAIGYRGYALFQAHIPSSYLILPVAGDAVYHGLDTEKTAVADVLRSTHGVTVFDAGSDLAARARLFVDDVERVIDDAGLGRDAVVGLERMTTSTHDAISEAGWSTAEAEPVVELARSLKIEGELDLIRHAIDVAELGMAKMEAALEPGITENRLWSILHQVNVEHDGDWIDGRMLCSGHRSNPWYQEASHRTIDAGDVVPFDTDMVGPFGYCADVSRTFLCGDVAPTAEQQWLYDMALAEIEHNTNLLHVGASFRELSHSVLRQPDDVVAIRYACAFHGVGMSDEYPKIPYPDDWEWTGYDGEITEGLVLSVESYVGPVGGSQGVKLEQMVQVTSAGVELLSRYPFWD